MSPRQLYRVPARPGSYPITYAFPKRKDNAGIEYGVYQTYLEVFGYKKSYVDMRFAKRVAVVRLNRSEEPRLAEILQKYSTPKWPAYLVGLPYSQNKEMIPMETTNVKTTSFELDPALNTEDVGFLIDAINQRAAGDLRIRTVLQVESSRPELLAAVRTILNGAVKVEPSKKAHGPSISLKSPPSEKPARRSRKSRLEAAQAGESSDEPKRKYTRKPKVTDIGGETAVVEEDPFKVLGEALDSFAAGKEE